MEKHFDSKEYIKHIATELIRNFEYSTSATTPVLVGSAREKEVIRKLELLLPSYISIGSGCIIDSIGNTSKQMDIVLYEKDFCPVFCINGSAESTYYPCEGVVAVGEVKSILNTKELENIFAKAHSVKLLQRYSVPEKSFSGNPTCSYRSYGNRTSFQGTKEESYEQNNKSTDQIFCFALCGKLDMTIDTLENKFISLLKNCNYENEINLISILDYGLICYINSTKNCITNSAKEGNSVFITGKRNNNFEFLLSKLQQVIDSNRTVPLSALTRYLSVENSISTYGGRIISLNKNN